MTLKYKTYVKILREAYFEKNFSTFQQLVPHDYFTHFIVPFNNKIIYRLFFNIGSRNILLKLYGAIS